MRVLVLGGRGGTGTDTARAALSNACGRGGEKSGCCVQGYRFYGDVFCPLKRPQRKTNW